MKLAFAAGFAIGTAVVLWTFWRELSDNREKMRSAKAEKEEIAEQEWRAFLAKWEAA